MKSIVIFVSAMAAAAFAFTTNSVVLRKSIALQAYVPDGMTPEEWKKLQEKEKAEKSKKNFGAFGPQSFKSRSLQSFQKDLEKGKADHLLPVFNAKEKVKAGQIRPEDIPYMQRGGAWDNSDVKTAKKKQWNEEDKKYNPVVTKVGGLDWSGTGSRTGPSQPKNNNQSQQKPATRKLFGMF